MSVFTPRDLPTLEHPVRVSGFAADLPHWLDGLLFVLVGAILFFALRLGTVPDWHPALVPLGAALIEAILQVQRWTSAKILAVSRPATLAGAAPGSWVRVPVRIAAPSAQEQGDPVTGTPCVWYLVETRRFESMDDAEGTLAWLAKDWTTSETLIRVTDDSGEAWFDPALAFWAAPTDQPDERLTLPGTLRWQHWIWRVQAGERVTLVGALEVAPGGARRFVPAFGFERFAVFRDIDTDSALSAARILRRARGVLTALYLLTALVLSVLGLPWGHPASTG